MKQSDDLLAAGLVLAVIACAAGALGTAWFVVSFGLLAPRPPLSVFETALRVAAGAGALVLLAVRRDAVERIMLACWVIAAGSSALFGLGVRSSSLSAARLIVHFAAYTLGAVVLTRLLVARRDLHRRNWCAS